HIVVVSHYSPMLGFETIGVVQVASAALLGMATFRLFGPVRFHATPGVAGAVLITGLPATALAFTAMAWSQQFTTATRAALIFALEPVVAWLTSYFLTGEAMTGRGKAGAGLILAGVLLVELRAPRAETSGMRETSDDNEGAITPDV
ncbi:MAG: DMT family transporter, partial [Bryobacteraceae bacterium]